MRFLYLGQRSHLENIRRSRLALALEPAEYVAAWAARTVQCERSMSVSDLIFIASGLGFFAVSILYVAFCDRL
jgi:hypothetical protein